jgi:hypothetical protein
MREKMKNCILEALQDLIDEDIDIIKNATKEECINHKFAQYLERRLNEAKIPFGKVDIEYNKYKEGEKKMTNGRTIRPDVIVHERRSGNKDNLIVIEAKKGYSSAHDVKKVTDLVDSSKYKYKLGVLVSYLPDKEYIKVKFYNAFDDWLEEKLTKNSS